MRVRGWLGVLVAVALLVCGGHARAADTPLKLRIAYGVPIGSWASIIYEKKDLMTHLGHSYEVETVRFQATPPMIEALASGDLEIADLSYSAFALAVENAGMSGLRVIADEGQDGIDGRMTDRFWVLKDGPIKTIDDLKGKVLATASVGAALDIPVRAMLRKHGLEDKRDVTMLEVPFPNMLPMLLDHKVDFMPSPNPFARDPRLGANAVPLFSMKEAMGGSTQLVVWNAQASFIAQHRAVMVDVMEDAIRATRFFTDPANHAEVMQIAARVMKLPPERFDYVYTKDDTFRDPDMRPNLAALQRAVDVQHDSGFLKQKLDVDKYADLSLISDAVARIK